MGWSTTSDLDQFAAVAGSYLTARAAENILLLSAVQAAQQAQQLRQAQQQGAGQHGAGLLYGWWTPPDGGDPRGAFVYDPAVPLLISGRVPELAAALAVALAKPGRQVHGVDAPTEAADAFAAAWSQRAGTAVRAHRNCRVYRLTAQATPLPQGTPLHGTLPQGMPAAPDAWPPPEIPGPPGRLRVATTEDLATLTDWLSASAIEAAQRLVSPADLAADLISYSGAIFWEVPHRPRRLREAAHYLAIPHHRDMAPSGEPASQPVALVTLTRPVAGTVRIAMVYTLPDRRHRGYAAALTQAVSRALLWGTGPDNPAPGILGTASTSGCVREVVMITDENRLDRWGGRFGYQLVSERAVLRFGPAAGPVQGKNPTKPMPRLPTGPLPRLPRPRR